jgi:hypothetical protein
MMKCSVVVITLNSPFISVKGPPVWSGVVVIFTPSSPPNTRQWYFSVPRLGAWAAT